VVPLPCIRPVARSLVSVLFVGIVAGGVAACSIGQPHAPPESAISTTAEASTRRAVAAPGTPQLVSPPIATVSPTSFPTVAAPTDLTQQTLGGKALDPNGWSVRGVTLSLRAPAEAGQALVPQVEVAKLGQEFRGEPTVQGNVVPAKGHWVSARLTIEKLAPGQYHWQARFLDTETRQAGTWSVYDGGAGGFGIVDLPPSIQNLAIGGVEHAIDGVPAAGKQDRPVIHWTVGTDVPNAIDHLILLADHQQMPSAAPPAAGQSLQAFVESAPLPSLEDGQWFIHLWVLDKAGQSSQPATVPVLVMQTAPRIESVLYRTWATNPVYQSVPIQFSLSRAADVSVSILPAASVTAIRTYALGRRPADQVVRVAWDGRDRNGQVVPPGAYRFLIDVVDDAGNRAEALYTGLTITNKVIKISLGAQLLTAYEGDRPFLTTLVTSGGADLPTPVGQFEILEKEAPFVFHSPYPRGSKFWFPDVKSNYAMLFDQADADFIHDAPWRSRFGPGTNGPGIPGQVYTGSHGCVETPVNVMPRLYPWTPLGTPVIISP
jgi:hypothetical protein